MTWIQTISHEEATGKLRKTYDRVKGPDGRIDNILLSHGLRPATLVGHMALYKNVLHHSDIQLPKWLREALGTWVSLLNGCDYCYEHHYEGMCRFLDNRTRGEEIRAAFESRDLARAFQTKEIVLFEYATKLTQNPAEMNKADVNAMRAQDWDDGTILEVNQIVAYFAYANRTVLGLGVNLKGDALGLSPNDSDDPDNWSHR